MVKGIFQADEQQRPWDRTQERPWDRTQWVESKAKMG